MGNPLIEIQKYGQSIWYDNIRRALLETGDIRTKIEQDGLRGVTSNPTIFEKAISGSTDYDRQMRELTEGGAGRYFNSFPLRPPHLCGEVIRITDRAAASTLEVKT